MEDKKLINIEIERNGNKYYFVMPDNCPIGEAFDAAYEIITKIVGIANNVTDNIKPKEEIKSEVEQ